MEKRQYKIKSNKDFLILDVSFSFYVFGQLKMRGFPLIRY